MSRHYEIIIIGTGFGGLGMGHDLKKAGRKDFLILEKADSLGGTWRENTYPGAECDVNSCLYSYSYALNPDWNYKWSKQPQILQYMKDISQKYGLDAHMQFGTKLEAAHFNEAEETWILHTSLGEFSCRYLVSAVGQLHHPRFPTVSGREDFKGEMFHAAKWNHDVELRGKRVAVIGSAASAVQLIPEVAEQAEHLTIFQRSPNWILRKGNRRYLKIEKWLAKTFPFIMKMNRSAFFAMGDRLLFPGIEGRVFETWILKRMLSFNLKKHIKDPELRKVLTPDYPVGAKRILFADGFYPALLRDDVDLVASGIDRLTEDSVIASNGTQTQADVVIFATGFYTNPFLLDIDVRGRGGARLADHWEKGAYAYNGTLTSGFPNLFFLYGPSTNTGSGSIIFFLEQQIQYIVQLMGGAKDKVIEVKPEPEMEFVDEMQSRLSELAWAKIENSWYKDGDKIPNNWPGTMKEFAQRLSTPNPDHFV
jgi:cation diffusion facilitator CzcD-associated flavoprotein CzcO